MRAAAYRLSVVVAGVMLAQACLGLTLRSKYRDVEWIATTWLGNDWVTLMVASPLLVAGVRAATVSRSPRGVLLWFGALGYAVYNYAYYAFGAALNVFFPLYLAGTVAAALALLFGLSSVSLPDVMRSFSQRTPVRLVGGYFVFVGLSLAGLWLAMWAAYAFAGRPTPVAPEAFKLVAALDIILMVPTLVIGGLLLWRRQPWGFVLGVIAGVQGSLYLLVLSINSIIFVARGLSELPGELPMWGTLAALTSTATIVLLAGARHQAEV